MSRFKPLALFVLALMLPSAAFADGAKTTVAVYADHNSPHLEDAAQFADILGNQIVEKGDLAVVDRQHTQSIVAEQATSSAGQVTPTTQAQLGRMLGVKYLVVVRIESLEAKAEQRNDVISILSKQSSYVTKVSLSDSITIIDVRSAQIVQTVEDEQQTTSPPNQAADQAFVPEAVTSLLKASASVIAGKIDASKLVAGPAPAAIAGKVIDVEGDSVTLSLGKSTGVTVGELLDLFQVHSVVNPDTGKTIQTLLKQGQLEVTQVEDDYSIAKPLAGVHPLKLQVVRSAAQ